jgi:hypothetical protein
MNWPKPPVRPTSATFIGASRSGTSLWRKNYRGGRNDEGRRLLTPCFRSTRTICDPNGPRTTDKLRRRGGGRRAGGGSGCAVMRSVRDGRREEHGAIVRRPGAGARRWPLRAPLRHRLAAAILVSLPFAAILVFATGSPAPRAPPLGSARRPAALITRARFSRRNPALPANAQKNVSRRGQGTC